MASKKKAAGKSPPRRRQSHTNHGKPIRTFDDFADMAVESFESVLVQGLQRLMAPYFQPLQAEMVPRAIEIPEVEEPPVQINARRGKVAGGRKSKKPENVIEAEWVEVG